ncbi:MAG: hypothetical protein WD851_15500 [Pirellulales bacterium]
MEFRTGFERAFTFNAGGGLHVYGAYVGQGNNSTLLWLPDRTQGNVGTFEIHGLQVDGNNRNLTLVSHGDVAHRVRIDGNVNKGGAANPPVQQRIRPVKAADVVVDCLGAKWPIHGSN